jgi:hypothetical protein
MSLNFNVICEIGTGNGLLIKCISDRTDKKTAIIGCDISSAQIEKNKRIYANERINFINSNAFDAIAAMEAYGNGLLVSCGTLEYFSPDELLSLFLQLKEKRMSILIHEPSDCSIEQKYSSPRGKTAYSHGYKHHLNSLGYSIKYCDVNVLPGRYRSNITMLATIE